VLGASFDTPEENKEFAENESFPFRLLADPDRQVGKAYGVARPDDDPAAGYANRFSFLIDPEGVIRRVYEVTDTAGHADAVLEDLEELRAA